VYCFLYNSGVNKQAASLVSKNQHTRQPTGCRTFRMLNFDRFPRLRESIYTNIGSFSLQGFLSSPLQSKIVPVALVIVIKVQTRRVGLCGESQDEIASVRSNLGSPEPHKHQVVGCPNVQMVLSCSIILLRAQNGQLLLPGYVKGPETQYAKWQ
jgi:hypothetical protein